jgi:hypothetical protein
VHACWGPSQIQYLQGTLVNSRLTDQLLQHYKESSSLHEEIETTLKGKELQMPEGLSFYDKDGHLRNQLRIKWWLNPEKITYKRYSIENYDPLPDQLIPEVLIRNSNPYPETEKPVFFGHYWLKGDAPASLYEKNVYCVDYSVAKQDKLVAYRWNGEIYLNHTNIYHVTLASTKT